MNKNKSCESEIDDSNADPDYENLERIDEYSTGTKLVD